MLVVSERAYDPKEFCTSSEWDLSTLSESERRELRVLQCTPARHELDECPALEESWRRIFPRLMTRLAGPDQSVVVSINGPFEDGELILAIAIVCGQSDGTIYHVPQVEDTSGKVGYFHSWFSFVGTRDKLEELLSDPQFDPEFSTIWCSVVPSQVSSDLLCRERYGVGLRWYVENSRALVVPTSHFEGCYILTNSAHLERYTSLVLEVLEEVENETRGAPPS